MDGGASADPERLREHGGRLSVARRLHPDAPTPWIDLSTGINPDPYRAPRVPLHAHARLPDPEQLEQLQRVAAKAFGVDDHTRVVPAAGTELALRLLPVAVQRSNAVIVGPTYSSHAHAWRSSGASTRVVGTTELGDSFAPRTAVIIVNPNNPDGDLVSRERLLSVHDALAANGGVLIVDEAFIDVTPAASISQLAGTDRAPHLIVLRSFGKFYGLAGVRLGFAIAAPSIGARLRALLGDWPVSADALAAGIAAYNDTHWADQTRARLRVSAARLDATLVRCGFEIVGGTSLYRLARHPNAKERFQQLLRAGVLTRPFDHDPTLIRFGLPQGAAAWKRLAHALGAPR